MSAVVRTNMRPGVTLAGGFSFILGCVLLLLATQLVDADENVMRQPLLRVETGMHTSPIESISTDAAGRIALTVSQDSARLWELPSGRPLRVLRPPIVKPDGELVLKYGKLSPDGAVAVIAVRGDKGILLFDIHTGRIRVLEADSYSEVAFSQTGRLIAGVGTYSGGYPKMLVIWEVGTGRKVAFADIDASYAKVDWHGDDRLVARDAKGELRLFQLPAPPDRSDEPQAIVATVTAILTKGKEVSDVRFSPDGRKIAVAFLDPASIESVSIEVVNGSTLKSLFVPDTQSGGFPKKGLNGITWSGDGSVLAAAGNATKLVSGAWKRIIRRWPREGEGRPEDILVGAGSVMALCPLPGREFLFSTTDPAWGVVSGEGVSSFLALPLTVNFWNPERNLLVSSDGTEIQSAGERALRFSLTARRLEVVARSAQSANLLPTSTQGLKLTDWKNGIPKLNGVELYMNGREATAAVAIASDSSFFLLLSERGNHLKSFDGELGFSNWDRSTPTNAQALNVATQGKLAVVAYADGTVRWYSRRGSELLAFFPHPNGRHWVLWTPAGHYDASPGGEDLIGWYVSTDSRVAADFFPASRFREKYYRPDVIDRVLKSIDSYEALKLADEGAGRKSEAGADTGATVKERQPPSVELALGGTEKKVEIAAGVSGVTLRYRVKQGGSEPVTRVRVMVDGRPALVDAAIPKDDETVVASDIPLPPYDCSISLMADNRFAASEPAVLRVIRRGDRPTQKTTGKPRLFILAVGINDYLNDDAIKDLPHSVQAATDFTEVMQKQQGRLYSSVEARLLTDKKATAGDILDGFDWLRQQTGPDDTTMVFIATHGGNDAEMRYYFCAHDFDPKRQLRTTVSSEEVQRTVDSVPGKVIFFLDTCHAGNALNKLAGPSGPVADVNRVSNELASDENGAVVFSASTGRQASWQSSKWTRGLFAQALIEGLEGKADLLGKGVITVASLETYVAARVPDLYNDDVRGSATAKEHGSVAQTPSVAKPQTIPDFAIALRDGGKR